MVPLCAEKIHMSRRKVMAARGKTGRILLRNKDAELL